VKSSSLQVVICTLLGPHYARRPALRRKTRGQAISGPQDALRRKMGILLTRCSCPASGWGSSISILLQDKIVVKEG